MDQFQAKLCAGMLSPMDGEVGHGIGIMSLVQIDYSTRIGSLNEHSTKVLPANYMKTQYLSKYN